jgi:bifunctional DNase/RNase
VTDPEETPVTGPAETPVTDPGETEGAALEAEAPDELDRQRSVTVVGVTVELPSPNPVLSLREVEYPWRAVHIPVGMPEGAAIASALRQMRSPRPLTHDLFADVLQRFGIRIDRVVVTDLLDATFHAEIVMAREGESAAITCRPSDGVALSLRHPYAVPVFVTERVLRAAGATPQVG